VNFDQPLIDDSEIAEYGETRAMAIRICQIAASGGVGPRGHQSRAEWVIARECSLSRAAVRLARAAWDASCRALDEIGPQPDAGDSEDAEAECLLRDGWSPGEPVVRLRGAR